MSGQFRPLGYFYPGCRTHPELAAPFALCSSHSEAAPLTAGRRSVLGTVTTHLLVRVRARTPRTPKNTRPFQRVPVMARAIADSDL